MVVWMRPAITTILISILAFAAGSHSWSRVAPRSEIWPAAVAHPVAPLRVIDRAILLAPTSFDADLHAATARKSLAIDPLNPRAIRLLAMQERVNGNAAAAMSLLRLSDRLSRRDLLTQLLLIEALAANQGTRISEVLALYDQTLRVNPEWQERMVPALAQVALAKNARNDLLPYVRNHAPWADGVLRKALEMDGGTEAVVDILMHAFPGKTINVSDQLASALFENLAQGGNYLEARSMFLRMPETSVGQLDPNTIAFSNLQDRYGALVWKFNDTPEAGVELIRSDLAGQVMMRAYLNNGVRSMPVEKLMFLKPNSYRISWQITPQGIDDIATANISIWCAGEDRRKPIYSSTVDVTESVQSIGLPIVDTGTAIIGCAVQYLNLSFDGNGVQGNQELLISAISISSKNS